MDISDWIPFSDTDKLPKIKRGACNWENSILITARATFSPEMKPFVTMVHIRDAAKMIKDGAYEITGWMPLPEVYKGEKENGQLDS